MEQTDITSHVTLATEIVSAYVSRNSVPVADLPGLIASVHNSIASLGQKRIGSEPVKPTPAVNPKKSVTDDYIISLEDGRKFKSMRRYLAGLGMTPQDYRNKWGLPHDYPMTAPGYAKQRSDLARSMGLGRKPEAGTVEVEPAVETSKGSGDTRKRRSGSRSARAN